MDRSFDWRSYSLNVLDNLNVCRELPRNILLNAETQRTEIALNLRELTKIQLNHLRKYHNDKKSQSPNCKCAYWQHYLNQFDPENEATEAKNQQEENNMIKFHECSYIFNARYFVDIISESPQLRGKVEVNDIPGRGFISLTITEDVIHDRHSLKGQIFEFTDTFEDQIEAAPTLQRLIAPLGIESLPENIIQSAMDVISGTNVLTVDQGGNGRRSRWKSLALFPQLENLLEELFDDEFKIIEIEIYPEKLRNHILCSDFSIDSTLIPLSSVTEFCDTEEDEVNIAIWFWEYIVENGLDDTDAIKDITQRRELRVPLPPNGLIELMHFVHLNSLTVFGYIRHCEQELMINVV